MKPKPFSIQPVLLLLLCLLLAACSPSAGPSAPATAAPTETEAPEPAETADQPDESGPLTFTDGLGRTVTLEGPAQRVVSLAPSNIELLYAVGAGSQVVARDEFTNYPEEALDLPSVGGSFGGFNNEAIVELQPDLILASELSPPELVKTLEDLGLTVYWLQNPVDIEGMYENLRIVAELTGHLEEAEALIASLEARVAAVMAKIETATSWPKVYYELDATDPNAPYTAGQGTFIDTLIEMAAGENVGRVLEAQYGQISSEELLVQDPEIILLGDAKYGVTPESLADRPGWENLSAVVNNQIFPFDDDLASRPGPRLVDALETLAELLHPELFQ